MSELFLALLFLFTATTNLYAPTYGSNSAPTRPSRLFFPKTDTNNNILGFAALDSGFFIEDYTTNCTYNDFFSISGYVGLTGGNFYLLQDLVLSNTLNLITPCGLIDAEGRSLELPATNADYSIPSIGAIGDFAPHQIASFAMTENVLSLGFNYNGQYLLAGSTTGGALQLNLYYLQGTTVTATTIEGTTGDPGLAANAIAWFPNDNYVAVALSSAPTVSVYYKRTNGSFALRSSISGLGSVGGTAVAWHPSGKFFVVGTNSGTPTLSYGFTAATGVIGAQLGSASINTVSNGALSFAPGGNFVVIGSPNSTFGVISVTGAGVLTAGTTVNTGIAVNAVDWCPTGTYIAIGTAAQANSLQMYTYLGSTLTQVAVFPEALAVDAVKWDPTGTFLAVAVATGTAPQFRIFYFDKVNLQFIEVYHLSTALNTLNATAWTRDSNFVAYGTSTSFNVVVYNIMHPPLWLNNTCLTLNANTNLYESLTIKNNCKINGRGKRLTLQTGSNIVVRPGASLIFEDIELAGLGSNNLSCLTDAATITFCHTQLDLARNLTFTRGSFLFQDTVALTGTNSLILSTGGTSTIASASMLYVGNGVTLQYAPIRPVRNLLYFTDPTSWLYLDHCSLTCTRTGLQVVGGSLFFDDAVTLSSQALYPNERMSLVSTTTIVVRSGANVSLYGYVGAD